MDEVALLSSNVAIVVANIMSASMNRLGYSGSVSRKLLLTYFKGNQYNHCWV
jgi:hypothetical protein